MWSKYDVGEKKNIFFNHEEHSKKDTETFIKIKNSICSRQCSVFLGPQVDYNKLKMYARKASEEPTFGLDQRYPKRRKLNDYHDEYSDYLGPFDVDHLTRKSIRNLCKYKRFSYRKLFKTSYKYSKFNPDIVMDFIKIPSIHKLTKVLDLMYNDSLYRLRSNNLGGCEKSIIRMSKELKIFLFDLCYHKFLTFWGPELEFAKSKLDLFVLKEYKRLRRSFIKNTRANTTADSPNLRKFIICSGGLIRYAKKPQIVRCFFVVNTFCSILVKKSCRLIQGAVMKKVIRKGCNKDIRKPMFSNCIHPDIEVIRLKLYHEGTTIKKTFMEIIDEYKHTTKNNRLNFSQISDIRCAYERVLGPGECIDKSDLEKCANENYNYDNFQNGTDLNHTIIFNDLTTVNNDDFDLELDDSDIKPENVLNESDMIPNFSGFASTTVVNHKADKLPQHIIDWVEEVRSRNYFRYKLETFNGVYIGGDLNESAELIEKEVHTKFTSNEDPNIPNEKETLSHCLKEVKMSMDSLIQERTVTINQDREISTDSLEGKSVINYSEAEASENLEKEITMVNSEQKNVIDVLVNKISTDNSEEDEEVEDEEEDDDDDDEDVVDVDIDDDDDNDNDDNERREGGGGEGSTINSSEEKNISSHYSEINKYFKRNLLKHSMKVAKTEKKLMQMLIKSKFFSHKINFKKYKKCMKMKVFQNIIYNGSLRMAICEELNLHRLGIINDKTYKKLLESIKNEDSMLQQFFTFNGEVNFLIWPLGEDIVNSIIPRSSSIINTLFVFVKNAISTFCEKIKILLRKSGLTIVLNKESLFENLCNEQKGKDVFINELSLEYTNINIPSSSANIDKISTHVPEKLITENLDLKNTSCFIKKNSSNAEICKTMINIIKSDESNLLSWEKCNNFKKFKSKLLQVGLTLPIEEGNTLHGAKFIQMYASWFCKEYFRGEHLYKFAISILKNIAIHINTVGECINSNIDMAIDYALIILYHDPCFAKVYKSYINAKNPKCSTSSKFENSSDDKNHSDYKDCNKKGIEEVVNIEPDVNVETNTIDADNVGMSSVISEVSTSNVFDELNNIQVNGSETSNPQCLNYNSKNDFIHDFSKLLSENGDGASNNLFENIDVDENNLFNIDFINVDDSNCNSLQFNEANPFDDFPITKLFDDNIPLETHSVNDMLEINLQFQQDKNTEEVSLISSCDELVNYAVSDEISLEDLNMAAVSDEYGFDNAGVLLPPYN